MTARGEEALPTSGALLDETLAAIGPLDGGAVQAARDRHAQLTKPPGSLGRLEDLAAHLAGIQRRPLPAVDRRAVTTIAADHGVAAEGVSAYPQAVTPQMVLNFLHGGAAINVLARAAGARVTVANFGVLEDVPVPDALPAGVRYVEARLAAGTANLAAGPAMSRDLATRAVEAGIALLRDEVALGLDVVATGEMGIANTTPSSCLVAALTGATPELVTGRGTGVDDARLEHKREVVARALQVNQPDANDPLGTLAALGGLEIAGLVGVILGAAAHRVAVVLDGFISGAAALVAVRLAPRAGDYLLAAHRSVEPGHQVVLAALGLEPLLDLRLRLGEGTGAALAFPVLDAACRVLSEMATFGEAGIAGESPA